MSESYGPVSTSPDAAMRRDTPGSASTDATDVKDTAKAEAGRVVDTAKAGSRQCRGRGQVAGAGRCTHRRRVSCATRPASSSTVPQRACARQATSCVRWRRTARPNPGLATDLVREASTRVNGVASWLGDRDPESLLAEVKSYARRRPGMFIGIALVAGVVAGRLTAHWPRAAPTGSPNWSPAIPGTGMGTAA